MMIARLSPVLLLACALYAGDDFSRPVTSPATRDEVSGLGPAAVADSSNLSPKTSALPDASLTEALEASRHEVRPLTEEQAAMAKNAGVSLFAFNPAQHCSARFLPGGVRFEMSAGEFTMAARIHGAAAVLPEKTGAREVSFAHGSGVTEWHRNETEGFRHGFTIHDPGTVQAGDGSGVQITVRLSGATASAGPEGSLIFHTGSGTLAGYQGLKVWDATGAALSATMQPVEDGFTIRVDDSGAQYPVTIDPLIVNLAATWGAGPAGTLPAFEFTGFAVDGNTAMIGSPEGIVYILEKQGGAWSLHSQLEDAFLTVFGGTIGLGSRISLSGNTAAITFGSGVRIYTKESAVWTQRVVITDPDPDGSGTFSTSLSLNAGTLLIGRAPPRPIGGYAKGRCYVFTGSGATWSEQARFETDLTQTDEFGWRTVVRGNVAVISADLVGRTYVSTRTGTTWSGLVELKDAANATIKAASLAFSGDYIAVGRPGSFPVVDSAVIFQRSGTAWNLHTTLAGSGNPGFGTAVALSGDLLAVGATDARSPYGSTDGAAILYRRSGSAWNVESKLVASDAGLLHQQSEQVLAINVPVVQRNFGKHLAFSTDGLVAGTSYEAWEHTPQGGLWKPAVRLRPGAQTDHYGDGFGYSVDLDETAAVIGVPYDDTAAGEAAGTVYVFPRNGAAWGQPVRLEATGAESRDNLGYSVSLSGDRIAAGAPNDDYSGFANAGSVLVFQKTGGLWSMETRLTDAQPAAGEAFGQAVALAGDTLAVGTPLAATAAGSEAGKISVLSRQTGAWLPQAVLTAPDAAAGDRLGHAVSMEGNTLLAGAPYDDTAQGANSGSVRVFVRTGQAWAQEAALTTGTAEDHLGWSVSLSGDSALVGAPDSNASIGLSDTTGDAYVFVRNGTVWSQQAAFGLPSYMGLDSSYRNQIGRSVSLHGNIAVVAMPRGTTNSAASFQQNNLQASILSYSRTGTTWTANNALLSGIGTVVAVHDGVLLTGYPNAGMGRYIPFGYTTRGGGMASVYTLSGNTWTKGESFLPTDLPGEGLTGWAVSVWGDSAVVGTDRDGTAAGLFSGAAHVFRRSAGVWSPQTVLTPPQGEDFFGISVAVHHDTISVGSHAGATSSTGSVYLFSGRDAGWLSQGVIPRPATRLYLHGDRLLARVNSAVEVHKRNRGVWSLEATLPVGNVSALAMDDTTAVLGAPLDGPSFSFMGAAYVFTRSGSQWTQQTVLRAPDTVAGDKFGNALALSGNSLAVTAPEDRNPGTLTPSLHIFRRSGGTWAHQVKLTPSVSASTGGLVMLDQTIFAAAGTVVTPFVSSADTWTEAAAIPLPDPQPSFFTTSLALSANTLLTGAQGQSFPLRGQVFAWRLYTDADPDGDGMPSAWETLYNLNPGDDGTAAPLLGPGADPDGDGETNLEEYLLGRIPTQPDDPAMPVSLSIEQPAGTPLREGSTVDFGSRRAGAAHDVEFTLRNTGSTAITGLSAALVASGAAEFTLTALPSATIPTGGTTTFTVRFLPVGGGARTTTLRVFGSPGDPAPFVLELTGRSPVAGPPEVTFVPSPGAAVLCAALQKDGSAVIGGAFSTVAGVSRNYLARISPSGALDTALNLSPGNIVREVAIQEDGGILLGGDVFFFSQVNRGALVRLTPGGSYDATFAPAVSSNVLGITPDAFGRILICGRFTSAGGQTRNRIARLLADGTLDTTFNPNADAPVLCMALQTDGKIVVGGEFSNIAGVARSKIARLLENGQIDPAFVPPTPNATANAVAVDSQGRIVVGGATLVAGVYRPLARLSPTGSADATFTPLAANSGFVTQVVVDTAGRVLAGGSFSTQTGQPQQALAMINPNGTFASDFGVDLQGPSRSIARLVIRPDGKILTGGTYATVDGAALPNLALLKNGPAESALNVDGTQRIQWQRAGASPESHLVSFYTAPSDSGPWSAALPGIRIADGWEVTGLSLPASGWVRARARIGAGGQSLTEIISPWPAPACTLRELWRQQHFGTCENTGPAADLANPDGDLLVNLLEYALGGNPNSAASAPAPTGTLAGDRVALTFTRSTANTDLTLTVQASNSLSGPWADLARSIGGGGTTAIVPGAVVNESGSGGTRTVEVRDSLPIAPTTRPRRFLRLSVSATP